MARRKTEIKKEVPRLRTVILTTSQKFTSLVIGASALAAAILYFFDILPVFWPTKPDVEIVQNGNGNPFLSVFRITNRSAVFAIQDIQIVCTLDGIKVGNDIWNTTTSTDQRNSILPKSSVTSLCPYPPGYVERFSHAKQGAISIVLNYQNPIWFGIISATKKYYLSTHSNPTILTEDKPVQIIP